LRNARSLHKCAEDAHLNPCQTTMSSIWLRDTVPASYTLNSIASEKTTMFHLQSSQEFQESAMHLE